MGLFGRIKQVAATALELDAPSQTPPPVEPMPGGWSEEQIAAAAATPPDRKGRVPGRAIVQETAGMSDRTPGKTLIDLTGTRVVLRLRLPGGQVGPRVDQALRMERRKLERVVRGLEVPALVNASTGEFVEIDVKALKGELG